MNFFYYGDWWSQGAAGSHPDNEFSTRYPWLKYMHLMTATGGAKVGTGGSRNLDMVTMVGGNPVYDFSPLRNAVSQILRQGLKPWIVTGNIPLAFSNYSIGNEFNINVRPPKDNANYTHYYNYIRALANDMIATYGINEVKTWRWGVLNELGNKGWFDDGVSNATTRDHIFKIYDYTVAALQSAIGANNLFVGTHLCSGCGGTSFPPLDFIDHAGGGTNYYTGGTGTQLNYIDESYYDHHPGVSSLGSYASSINNARNRANLYPSLANIEIGIAEGGFHYGLNESGGTVDMPGRTLGVGYQSAWDAKLFTLIHDNNASSFARWLMNTERVWGRVDNTTEHVQRLGYKMTGDARLTLSKTGTPADANNQVTGIAGKNDSTNKVHLMLYNMNDSVSATTSELVSITFKNVAPTSGSTVRILKWVVDDTNSNFFSQWLSDRNANSISTASSSYKSAVVPSTLSQSGISYWDSREDTYAFLSGLMVPTVQTVTPSAGTVTINDTLPHHSVVFYEVLRNPSTSLPKPETPTGLSAVNEGNQVRLEWNATAMAASWNVKRSTTSGGSYTTIASNVQAAGFTDSGVTAGNTYYYVVSASNSNGESSNSNQVSGTPVSAASLPIIDDFDGGSLAGWMVDTSAGTVTVSNVPSTTNKSVKFDDTNASASVSIDKLFTSQTGQITVEFKFMQPTINNWYSMVLKSGSTYAIRMMVKDGNISYRNNVGADISVMPYSANTWYTIKAVANIATNTYDIYVDNVLKKTGATFENATSNINAIRFNSGTSFTGITYTDDINVYVPTSSGTTNLAPSATLSVDSTDGTYTKDKAVDGIKNEASSRWISANTAEPHWFQLDWASSKSISNIKVWSGTPAGSGWQIYTYKMQYWNGSSWVDIPSASITNNTQDAYTGAYNNLSFTAVSTNKIRMYITDAVNQPDNTAARLLEIEVWGTSDSTTNLAPSATLSVDSTNGTYTKDKAVDGIKNDASSRWISANTAEPHWFQLDWASSKSISNIKVWSGTPAGSGWQIYTYKMQYWNGSSWVDIPGASITNNTQDAYTGAYNDLSFTAVSTNKIRMYITDAVNQPDNTAARLLEIEVWGN